MTNRISSLSSFSHNLAGSVSTAYGPRLNMRIFAVLFILLLLASITACGQVDDQNGGQELITPQQDQNAPTPFVEKDEGVVESPTVPIAPTVTSPPSPATIAPRASDEATEIPAKPLNDLSIRSGDISIYPDGSIYAGDLVSIRIDPRIPEKLAPNDVDVRVFVDGAQVVSNNVNWRGFDGSPFGLYQWVWDTDEDPGFHTIIVFLDPEDVISSGDESPANNVASLMVQVEPSDNLPENEINARWITQLNECCRVHVVSGTAAHRDIEPLLEQIDAAFQEAASKLSETLTGQYEVYLVDRVFGQGGYAQDAMVVSYLDRDYIAGELEELLVHEAVHLIDRKIAPNPISFLSEGMAVWIAGGHYHRQNLNERMNALVEIGRYRGLDSVIDDFYRTQHEVAYLEGAGFIDYLVSTYGLNQVKTFYVETTARDGDTLSEAVDVNLQQIFGIGLEEIEADWMAYIRSQPRDNEAMENLRTTIRYYDITRRYQANFDPSAYYLTTWLPDPSIAQRLGITADFSRHKESPVNIALETILVSAGSALQQGDYDRADALLDSVERVLDNNGAFLDPLALAYLNIVLTASDMGYEAQQIELIGDQATVMGSGSDDPSLVQIELALVEGRNWTLAR
jgi:hypothetical protein